jgi:hypothetical protein
LVLRGVLANDVPPWQLLGAPVELRVRDINHTPYCVSSTDELLETVLSTIWPHEDVLAALPE